MLNFGQMGMAALAVVFAATVAAAQPAGQASGRDPLWNGALIGAAAGLGATAALDGAFCEAGFGNCDFPWKSSLVLGGLGTAAGAGIDFLIRDRGPRSLRVAPIIGPRRRGALMSLTLPHADSLPRLQAQGPASSGGRRDSIWNGTLIGAGIGAVGGAVWGWQVCGRNDDECFAIAGPAGTITGAGIGAAIGAVADLLHD